MKKLVIVFFVFILTLSFNPHKTFSQTGYNAVLEYCTGTWCQWCPCAHVIINDILQNYPNTVVLGYHGANNDPWLAYSEGIRGLLGLGSLYPYGLVGRMTGLVDRSAWNNYVVIQSLTVQPGV